MINAYWDNNRNFGDKLTPWLIEKITNKHANFVKLSKNVDKYLLTGSILTAKNPNHNLVWGCGVAFDYDNIVIPKHKKIYGVRGPISHKMTLKNNPELNEVKIGDPGLLISKYYWPSVKLKHEYGIICSWVDYKAIKKIKGVHLIPTMDVDVECTVQNLLSCKKVFASCLHGLIACVSYGIPTRCVKFSTRLVGNGCKFKDFMQSINENYGILDMDNNIDKYETFIHNSMPYEYLLSSCPL